MSIKPFALSVKMLIRDKSGRFLVLKRSMDSRRFPGEWDFPGGKINPGEKFYEALLREVSEETGLEVAVEHVVGVTELELEELRVAVLIFEGRKKAGRLHLSEEHDKYAWVAPHDLQSWNLSKHLHSFVKTYSSQKKQNSEREIENGVTKKR